MIGNIAAVSAEQFADDGTFSNSRLPLLIYRAAVTPGAVGVEAGTASLAWERHSSIVNQYEEPPAKL